MDRHRRPLIHRVLPALIAGALLAPASAGAGAPDFFIRIAKTDDTITQFGPIYGGRPGVTITVKLFKETADGRKKIGTKRVQSRAHRKGASFRATFRRPRSGDCVAQVRYGSNGPTESRIFPCGIPDFGGGRAVMMHATERTEIDLLIADEAYEQGYGLMFRAKLRKDLGMAFTYDSNQSGAFWMRDTLIPLSIAFYDASGIILRILDMRPCTHEDSSKCRIYDPEVSYRGAVEVNQGAFDDWGISEGDRIEVTES